MKIYYLFIRRKRFLDLKKKEKINFYHLHITRISVALLSKAKIRGVTSFFDPLSLSLTIGFLLYFDSDSDSKFKIPIVDQ